MGNRSKQPQYMALNLRNPVFVEVEGVNGHTGETETWQVRLVRPFRGLRGRMLRQKGIKKFLMEHQRQIQKNRDAVMKDIASKRSVFQKVKQFFSRKTG